FRRFFCVTPLFRRTRDARRRRLRPFPTQRSSDLRKVLAESLKHIFTCDDCECASCPEGAELSYRAYRALGEAMDLLDGEKIVDKDRKSTRLNSSHVKISYAVFCLKKKMQ